MRAFPLPTAHRNILVSCRSLSLPRLRRPTVLFSPAVFQGALYGFLEFFRKMFGGSFEVDVENSVVSVTGQGMGNMPLKTAQCLEHGLRVCREDGFQV